ncbi:uncharacterized protein A4U43_C07F27470 [Asparagus officinalis]|uniref:Uncharacterized protein n=1 Tax=Asparagus officinalis TaxID=4686 RepID=A0A5P1EKK7_ASPOF|nr:uncharacterized protein A4U43_C07F27470 [Asparagus officinalis]
MTPYISIPQFNKLAIPDSEKGQPFALTSISSVEALTSLAIRREAKEFGLGEEKYYVVLIFGAIFWQFTNLGLVGVISCSSSLFGGILIAVLLPLLEILSVIFFHENFDGSKGVALALCLWGFVSYLYGERKQQKKLKKKREVELP